MTKLTGYRVLLRDNQTGEERWWKEDDLLWEEHSDYLWTEGNYACDCNRQLFFERAGGHVPDDGYPCGMERYTAVCAELPDGTQVPLDAFPTE